MKKTLQGTARAKRLRALATLIARERADAARSLAPPLPFFVVAGNFAQFRDWCRTQGLSERGNAARFITDPAQFRGYSLAESQVVFVGTWHTRTDAEGMRRAAARALNPRTDHHADSE